MSPDLDKVNKALSVIKAITSSQEENGFPRTYTPEQCLDIEVVAMGFADDIRIVGFDKFLMTDPVYRAAIHNFQDRGVDQGLTIEVLVAPEQVSDMESLVRGNIRTSERALVSESERLYCNGSLAIYVKLDSEGLPGNVVQSRHVEIYQPRTGTMAYAWHKLNMFNREYTNSRSL